MVFMNNFFVACLISGRHTIRKTLPIYMKLITGFS